MRFLTALFFAVSLHAVAQSPQVPHKMQFAGMTLSIRDDARREIQKDVDAITQSPKHFNIKVERAKTYFPVIERIFAEEGVPDDFKYLVIQESALIADAVSVSNAVGFWQFKEFTALEMGLRVDKEVDERLNIASASRGAARYFKKNNFYFNNWLYALQSYQMGAGGVMQSVKETQSGATHMEITSKTYWYVKKYLAHKVAYEDAVKGKGQIELLIYENKNRKSLADLSKEISVDEIKLNDYNKWARKGHIPDDKTYLVFIPVAGEVPANLSGIASASTAPLKETSKSKEAKLSSVSSAAKKINGIVTILALQGDTPTKLAARAGVDLSEFLKWNDISISDKTPTGQVYLLGKKRARSTEAYHKVTNGETLWSISQQYGVQQKKLRRFNRMKTDEVVPGTTLWLASMKPKESNEPVSSKDVAQINNQDTFDWNVESAAPKVVVQPPVTEAKITVEPATAPVDSSIVVKNEPVTVQKDTVTQRTVQDSAKILQAAEPEKVVAADTVKSIIVEPAIINKETHTVQAGETLYAIAKIYNVGVMELVRWNGLDLQKGIKPGHVIKLVETEAPGNKQETTIPTAVFHVVQASDTLYSVARKYGVTIKELMDWNGKKDFSLSTGEKLKVLQK
jgi:membrane-bound lytic murein transglycosylase D